MSKTVRKLKVLPEVPDDIDIANSVEPFHISEIAQQLYLKPQHYDLYGKCKSKVFDEFEENGVVFDRLVKHVGSPIDFELPGSLNKSKRPPYYSIRKNIYLTKKIKKRLEDDGIFCLCSTSSLSSVVCGKDCLCGMLMSSCTSGCKCGSSCANKPFHQRHMKKMKVVKTDKCGLGVVAEEDIDKGEFIIEYVGEVIDDKTCEERLWKMKHCGETNFYLCEINRDMVIDATYKGNKSRYINHSCSPNTEMQKWMIDGETRIGIFATLNIRKGEHLTYDYQFVQFGADQNCHCGAVECRRKLGVKQVASSSSDVNANGVSVLGGSYKPAHKRKSGRRNCTGSIIRLLHFSDKRSFGLIRQFNTMTRKHLIMFEDGSSEFVDLSEQEWEFCNC